MDDILIPLTAILMPLGIVMLVFKSKHRAAVREFEHKERMKAIEAGISPYQAPRSENAWPALVALGLGAFMPIGVFFLAWLSSMTTQVGDGIFVAATFVSGAGVIGGTRMGLRLLQKRTAEAARLALTPPRQAGSRKPAFDPDAYDAIAHRG